MTNTVTVTVSPAPVNKSFYAASGTICAGTSTNIILQTSQTGVTYQLRNNADNSTIGSAVAGTGGDINLPTGNLTVATIFNVYATITSTSCAAQMSGTVTVNMNALPLNKSISAAAANVCPGGSTNIQVLSSETNVYYTLRNNADNSVIGGNVTGNNGTINLPTGIINSNMTYNVLATSYANGCFAQMTGTVTVSLYTLPTNITPTAAASTICSGSATNIVIAGSQPGVTYQLRNNSGNANVGSAVAGTGGSINLPTGNLTATTTFNVLATNTTTTCNVQMTNTVTVTVSPAPVDKSMYAASGNVCYGTSTNIIVQSSQTGVTYQLRNNTGNVNIGAAVAGTGGDINLPTGNLTAATTFNVFATITSTTCAAQMTATVTVNINALPLNKIISAAAAAVCPGGSTNIVVTSSENNIAYQLRNNADNSNIGGAVTGNGGNINLATGTINGAMTYNVLATSYANGCFVQMAGTVSVTLNPLPTDKTPTAVASGVCPNGSTTIGITRCRFN